MTKQNMCATGVPELISKRATGLSLKYIVQLLLIFCLALLLPAGTALAQATNGLISGRVVDPQGASIPGATVTVRNQLTTVSQTTQTNNSGYFVFPEVLPGTYTVTVEKQGFERLQKNGIGLLAADRRSVGTLQLKLGSTKAVITVSGTGTPVQTTSSDQSAVITATEMAALPSLGRDYMALMRTLPGSSYEGEGNASLGLVTSTGNFDGLTSATDVGVNEDGFNVSISNAGWEEGPTVMDAIQSVKVLESNYEPEYGKVNGAVVNLTTKSGTTDFHGGLYYYGRNETLNANDFFNNRNGELRPRYRYNTFGGTLGGPIYFPGRFKPLRHKLFFFFAYDNEPSTVPEGPREYLMPTTLERQGDFSQSFIPGSSQLFDVTDPLTGQQFPGNVVPASRINPLMEKVLNIFPLPNFTNKAVSLGDYNYVIDDSNVNPTNEESLRIDYAPTDKWHIFGRWQRQFSGSTGREEPGISAGWMNGTQLYDVPFQRYVLNGAYTINSHMVNELAIGHEIDNTSFTAPQSTLNQFEGPSSGISFPQPYPQNNPLDLIPAMSFADGPSFSYDPRFPETAGYTAGWSINDGLNDVYKNHQLKFGIYTDFEQEVQPDHAGNGQFAGDFDFEGADPNNPNNTGYSYAEALLGYFGSYSVSSTRVDDSVTARTLEWYAQDNWQASKKLSLNYGARFTFDIPQGVAGDDGATLEFNQYQASEAPPLFQPVANGLTVDPLNGQTYPAVYEDKFVPGVGNPAPGSVTITSPNFPGFFKGKGVLIAPRLGFAYDLTGDGKTAIRGGFGAFYSQRTDAGAMYADVINPPTIFYPTQYYGNVDTFATTEGVLSPSTMYVYDPNSGLPYTLQWSLGVQREIGFKSVLSVAYVANVSRNNPYTINYNEVPYGAEFLPQHQDPATDTPLPDDYYRPFPGYSSIDYTIWGDNGNYNSLQVQLNRRFAHGLNFGLAYTWSKSLDDNRGTTYLPGSLTYGPTGINMPNRLVANWVWDVPKASRLWNNRLSRSVLDNWEVSGIASFISGAPMGVGFGTTNGENLTGGGDGDRVIVTGNPVLPKSQRTFDEYFNTSVFALPAKGAIGDAWTDLFNGPGVNDWDLALFKNFPVKERVTAQLRFEAYNAFNHVQFNSVNTSADFNPATGAQVNSGFGQLDGDTGPRIIQLSFRLTF